MAPQDQRSQVPGRGPRRRPTARHISYLFGKRIVSDVRFTAVEPNRSFSFEVAGRIKVRGTDTFEPLNGSTRVLIHHQGTFSGFLRFLEPLLGMLAARGIREDLKRLKQLMESGEYEHTS